MGLLPNEYLSASLPYSDMAIPQSSGNDSWRCSCSLAVGFANVPEPTIVLRLASLL